MKILIALIAIGLLLVPVVSAGIPFQNFGKVFTSPIGKPNVTKITSSPIDYSYLLLPFGFSPHVEHIVCDDNGLCYDENSTVCGSCTTDPFLPTTKSPWLAWAQVPYQPAVLDPNAPLIHGTQFDLTRDEFLRRHDYSELV